MDIRHILGRGLMYRVKIYEQDHHANLVSEMFLTGSIDKDAGNELVREMHDSFERAGVVVKPRGWGAFCAFPGGESFITVSIWYFPEEE